MTSDIILVDSAPISPRAEIDELRTQLAVAERQLKELSAEVIRLRRENRDYERALGLNEAAS